MFFVWGFPCWLHDSVTDELTQPQPHTLTHMIPKYPRGEVRELVLPWGCIDVPLLLSKQKLLHKMNSMLFILSIITLQLYTNYIANLSLYFLIFPWFTSITGPWFRLITLNSVASADNWPCLTPPNMMRLINLDWLLHFIQIYIPSLVIFSLLGNTAYTLSMI